MAQCAAWMVACLAAMAARAEAEPVVSHAVMRPLPVAANRPAASGPGYYVDPASGDDAGPGSAQKPWKTIAAAATRLKPGDTLYLRGGTYFESVALALAGTAKAPITIRSAPGELAILDGGLRDFERAPSTAWEPAPGGAPGELRSVRPVIAAGKRGGAARASTDPGAAGNPAAANPAAANPAAANPAAASPDDDRQIRVLGNFADSMIPLHGYRFAADLRARNEAWNLADKDAAGAGIYVGPGVWLDDATGKVHVRLARTTGQPDNYAGETDARKLALVIAIDRSALAIAKSTYVRLQDLVIRGSAARTLAISASSHVELDGVTIFGGAPALWISATDHLRMTRSVVRGTAAPWSSRASMKYRGDAAYLVVVDSQGTQSRDWELAYNEFTDGHDGLVIDSLKGLRFHHNAIDNLNDDGLYLTLPPRAAVPEGVEIYENLVTRVYTALAFAGAETRTTTPSSAAGAQAAPGNPIGPGVFVYRNVFDLRDGTYAWPAKPGGAAELAASRLCGDHGSPTWEPLMFYQNTVITAGNAFRDYYAAQLVMGTRGTKRRLLNNVFVQVDGLPGLVVPVPTDDVVADGNWLWGLRGGPSFHGEFFAARAARPGPAGFGAHDGFGDPRLVHLVDGDAALDVRPAGGGVVDAGVAVPAGWPDSLRAADRGKPDIGALPLGAAMLRVGPAAAPKP